MYQFDGEFMDSSWATLPSPEEVKVSVIRAIAESSPQVFKITVDRVDVTVMNDPVPEFIPAGFITANVVVRWDVDDDD